MLAKVNSAALFGLDALPIEVEVDIASQGLPSFTIVGLPDKAVEESKERVRSAIKNSGATFPAKRITVNLAPADLPKEGPAYDLPIALGILIASGQLAVDLSDALVFGELALDGNVRRVSGVLSQVLMAKEKNFKKVFLPKSNAQEASVVSDVTVYPIASLLTLFQHLSGITGIEAHPTSYDLPETFAETFEYDLADIQGQEKAKRAMEIAAAGGHNMLLKGPPGAGKTLLARTLPSILPMLSFEEALEVTKIYSIAGLLRQESLIRTRPFRSPHHTTSHIGLVGGGTIPKPGEITLAHRGILFLDELPEFSRAVLEALRQPLEDGHITIARARGRLTFPAKCMLVAAQNPCPCGYFGDPKHACRCSPMQILRYQKKISGPLLDRIDIHLEVPAVPADKLSDKTGKKKETSQDIQKRVQQARNRQTKRFQRKVVSNAEMTNKHIKELCPLSPACLDLLKNAVDKLHLSARSYYRTIKVARTIADLAKKDVIEPFHIAEALQYRQKADSLPL